MESPDTVLIGNVRAVSRELVREFGLMNKGVAGTELSLSSVHAIIEIGRARGISSRELSDKLLLEKSTISRLVKTLIGRGEVREERSGEDSRVKHLSLTPRGIRTLRTIDDYAQSQVAGALATLDGTKRNSILQGLRDYVGALRSVDGKAPAIAMPRIETGYAPTLIGRIVDLLLQHMSRHFGFARAFEVRIAHDLAEFMSRIESSRCETWRAVQAGRIVGSVSIDGEDLESGLAHLRWFVVDERCRGQGTGQGLLDAALDFCDRMDFRETHLWTVRGLDAARRLYEARGFKLVEEYTGDQWGSELVEQKFVRVHPANSR